ncbi:MAG: hypothetical protein P8O03_15800 [Ilumatobacter sp.]|nr:hypothetical protein [Ilumatobacter sp.]
MSGDKYVDDYEDVSGYHLGEGDEQLLVEKQTECTFMWTNSQAEPVGVVVNYVFRKGAVWVTCTRMRKRIKAIEARPRVAISISSRGTSIGRSMAVTYKGSAVIHSDEATNQWMNTELANAVRPGNPEQAAAFAEHLSNSHERVAIEIVPDQRIGFDSASLFANSPAGPSQIHVE